MNSSSIGNRWFSSRGLIVEIFVQAQSWNFILLLVELELDVVEAEQNLVSYRPIFSLKFLCCFRNRLQVRLELLANRTHAKWSSRLDRNENSSRETILNKKQVNFSISVDYQSKISQFFRIFQSTESRLESTQPTASRLSRLPVDFKSIFFEIFSRLRVGFSRLSRLFSRSFL